MGIKGGKTSEESILTANLITAKLESMGGITSKKMFGGHGIFHEAKMFCIVDSKGLAYLKADDSSKQKFEAMGSQKHSRMPYYSIPQEILSDFVLLNEWAQHAISISK